MSKITKKIFLIVLIFALILIGMSTVIKAEDTEGTQTENKEFGLNETEITVKLNSTKYLFANNKPSGETVVWSSSNPNVATVEDGTVKGLSIGTTTITATAGTETATCQVTVIYGYISMKSNTGTSVSSMNLVLEEYPTETLIAEVEDGKSEKVENAVLTWTSSNPSVATVDSAGKVTAVGAGTVTITAQAAGVSDTCKVTVGAAPKFTDFSKANYEILFDTDGDLKITGITPIEKNQYYYIITPNNKKPAIALTSYGALDEEKTGEVEWLICNMDEKYMYNRNIDKYLELNQDIYIWIIEEVKLDTSYTKNGDNYISYSTKLVAEGKKLTRPQLPQLNLILQSLSIWGGENKSKEEQYSSIRFRFPSQTENRKFKLKIGKVTDNSILQKIQKNDYSGITELLQYAKNNEAIYTKELTTTWENYYKNDQALFDGIKLLKDDAYYYIYVEFDDENGKYYPIEGVTLGQAWIASSGNFWDLYAYTEDNFKWNNLSSSYTEDDTLAKDNLPDTGVRTVVVISILALTGTVTFFKIKNNKYKEI